MFHRPSHGVYPKPGTGGVEALDGVVGVEWIEKQEAGLCVVLWAAQSINEDEKW